MPSSIVSTDFWSGFTRPHVVCQLLFVLFVSNSSVLDHGLPSFLSKFHVIYVLRYALGRASRENSLYMFLSSAVGSSKDKG